MLLAETVRNSGSDLQSTRPSIDSYTLTHGLEMFLMTALALVQMAVLTRIAGSRQASMAAVLVLLDAAASNTVARSCWRHVRNCCVTMQRVDVARGLVCGRRTSYRP